MRVTKQGDWAALSYNVRSIREFQELRKAKKAAKAETKTGSSPGDRRHFWIVFAWSAVFFLLLAALVL